MMGDPHDVSQSSHNKKLNRKPTYSRFKQQELPDLKPLLSPKWVIGMLMAIGIVFVPVGLLTLSASASVMEVVFRYDDLCIPANSTANTMAYIQSPIVNKTCFQSITIPKKMKRPIYVYYELTNFYQNHRRYTESRSGRQMRSNQYKRGSDVYLKCSPEAYVNGDRSKTIVPCGIVAWSLFNDTYALSVNNEKIDVSKRGISWFHEPNYRYGADVYPQNFQMGSLIGGGTLNEHLPLSEQEDLMVWMRNAPLSTFRKLYGSIQSSDLEVNQVVQLVIENNYNSYMFGGQKKIVLSTASWLGGKNDFLGKAYLIIGGLSLSASICFMILYCVKPRRFGDPNSLSWRKNEGA